MRKLNPSNQQEAETDDGSQGKMNSRDMQRHALLQWLHGDSESGESELLPEVKARRATLPYSYKLEKRLRRSQDAKTHQGGHSDKKLKIDKDGNLVERKSTEGD